MSDDAIKRLVEALRTEQFRPVSLFAASNPQMPQVYSPTGTLAPGQTEMGNINLMDRPNVPNPEGGWSSVRSMNVTLDGDGEVLMPTVSPNRIMEPDEAIQQYRQTGQHLGKFTDPASAEAYATALHNQQEAAGLARPAPPYSAGSIFTGWNKR